MTDRIKHQGTVINIEEDCVKVKITQQSACSTCSIKGHCNASESKEKIVDVYDCRKKGLEIGDVVTIIAASKIEVSFLILFFIIITFPYKY